MIITTNRKNLQEKITFSESDSIIRIDFFKNFRKNSKILKTLYISLKEYKIDDIANILDSFILLSNNKDLNISMTILKNYKIKYNKIELKTNLDNISIKILDRKKHYSIECLINDIIEACIIATNGESVKNFIYAHDDSSIRYFINKYYSKNRGL